MFFTLFTNHADKFILYYPPKVTDDLEKYHYELRKFNIFDVFQSIEAIVLIHTQNSLSFGQWGLFMLAFACF